MPRARSEVVISRLEKYAGEWVTDVARSKGYMVVSHYFSLPNHRGGTMDPMQRYYKIDGKEVTFKDVPIAKVTEAVEKMIVTKVPATEIYHKVLTGMPGHQPIPEWGTKSSTSIYEKPLMPSSKPRDAGVSNQDLLDALALAAEITLKTAKNLGTQITWWDAMSDGAFCCSMSFGDGVSEGRLGRPHKLDDVPVNHCRDRLMDFIGGDREWSEDRKYIANGKFNPSIDIISTALLGLNDLCERPYWSCIWIQQEFTTDVHMILLCGSRVTARQVMLTGDALHILSAHVV